MGCVCNSFLFSSKIALFFFFFFYNKLPTTTVCTYTRASAEDRDNAVVHGLLELTHDPACPACSLHRNLFNYFKYTTHMAGRSFHPHCGPCAKTTTLDSSMAIKASLNFAENQVSAPELVITNLKAKGSGSSNLAGSVEEKHNKILGLAPGTALALGFIALVVIAGIVIGAVLGTNRNNNSNNNNNNNNSNNNNNHDAGKLPTPR
jgi:hypothetical protein